MAANATVTACSNDRAIDYNPLSDNKRAFCKSGNWHTMDCTVTGDSCSTAGQVEYNTGANMLQYCNGTVWVDMAVASGCCGGGGGSTGPYWVVTAGMYRQDLGVQIAETSDNGFIAVARAGPSNARYVHLVKIDSSGNRDWSYKFAPLTTSDIPTDMMVTSTGDIIVVGTSRLGTSNFENGFIAKFNSSGTQQWTRAFGGGNSIARPPASNSDWVHSVVEDTDGGYIIGGHTGERNEPSDPLYLKYDTSGTLISYTLHTNTSGKREQYIKMAPLSVGGFVAVGQAETGKGVIAKLNSSGSVTTAKSFTAGGLSTKRFDDVIQTSNGDIIAVGGTSNGTTLCGGGGNGDAYIVRMSNDLSSVVWEKCLGGPDREKFRGVVEIPCTGDIIAVGYTQTDSLVNGTGESDGLITKFNSSGVEQWTKTITHDGGDDTEGGSVEEELSKVIIADDGSIVAVGNTSSSNGGSLGSNMIIVKLNTDGAVGGATCSLVSGDKGISVPSVAGTTIANPSGFGSYGTGQELTDSFSYAVQDSTTSSPTTITYVRQCHDP